MAVYNQIYITSINKAVNRARSTGNLDLSILGIYDLYKYYIDFTEGVVIYEDQNKLLKTAIEDLKYKYPDVICNYKNYIPTIGYQPPVSNSLPTVSGTTISLLEEESKFFTVADFTTNYSDPNNQEYGKVIIYLSGIPGVFKYNGEVVSTTINIDVEDVIYLEYTRVDALAAFSEVIPFRISDNDSYEPLYSTIASNTITGVIAGNQPATVGDNTIIVNNRTTTILILAMFTNQLTPPYNDPEMDLIDAIRIDEISTANLGTLKLNNIPIIEGQIITREDIEANLFTHEGPNQNTISSDNFSFSARDEGSLIWVN